MVMGFSFSLFGFLSLSFFPARFSFKLLFSFVSERFYVQFCLKVNLNHIINSHL